MNKIKYCLFLFIPHLLFSANYCIYIDKFEISSQNKSKIYSILNDVAYPSTKVRNNILYIYSGKFKTYNDASKLLPLTKSRYKNAKVASCKTSKIYKANTPIAGEIEATQSPKPIETPKISNNYCIKVFESSLTQSTKQKSKINYILNRLPDTRSEIKGNIFSIYSGNFDSLESANTIAKILKREFKESSVTTCNLEKKETPKKEQEVVTPLIESAKVIQEFNINNLDDKGLISREIASNSSKKSKERIEKEDVRHALDIQREEYFNGLYLKINSAYDTLNSDMAYDVRVEFDIFDQGYYESKKKNEKDQIDNQLSFYKTMKNIDVLKQEEEFLKIKKYENSISVSALLLNLRITEMNLNLAKRKVDNGVLTEYEYDEYKLSIQKIKDELLLFKNMTLLKIPKDLWILLNQIEYVKLIHEDLLIDMLEKDSVDLKLAKTLQEQKPLMEEWSDKLRVNIYAGQRKMYQSQDQTLIGVEAKIPLSSYSKTKELDIIQNSIMSTQVRLQYSQAKERLKDAIATFKYRQQKLKTYSYELSQLKKRIKDLDIINNSAFATYANLSFNSQQKAMQEYLTKYTQIQQERITTYKELINILYLIHAEGIKDILQYAIAK